jgi:hypothetical protein
VNSDDRARHLAGNRIGIHRRDRSDFVKLDANVSLLSRRRRNVDFGRWRRGLGRALVMTPQKPCDQQQH